MRADVQSAYDYPAPVSIEGRQERAEAIDVAGSGAGVTELICWQRLRIVHDRHLLTRLRNIEEEFGNEGQTPVNLVPKLLFGNEGSEVQADRFYRNLRTINTTTPK